MRWLHVIFWACCGLVLVLSVFDLINIPIGTIVGVYSIWVLVREDTVELFESRASVENALEGGA